MLITSQTSQLLFLFNQSLLGENAIQFSPKEMNKKPLNQTLQKLFGSGNGDEERHVLQSPLPY